MIINNCFNVRSLVLIFAIVIGLGLVNPANAQSYLVDPNSRTATRLGTLGGSFSGAQDINDAGQVVGDLKQRGAISMPSSPVPTERA